MVPAFPTISIVVPNYTGPLFGLVFYPYQAAIILLSAPVYVFRRVRWITWPIFG